jgi:WD40 repeat protein
VKIIISCLLLITIILIGCSGRSELPPIPTPFYISDIKDQGEGGNRTRILVEKDQEGNLIANSEEAGAGYRYDISFALSSPVSGGSMVQSYWLSNAEHIYLGEVELEPIIFNSDSAYPLTFKLIKDKGFLYMCGRGSITTEDGEIYKVGYEDTIDIWLPRLSMNDPILREAAAQAIGWLSVTNADKDKAVPALMTALEDKAWEVRRNAAEALGRIKDPRSSDILLLHTTTKGESDEWVREVASEAYTAITGIKATPEPPEATLTPAATQTPQELKLDLSGHEGQVTSVTISPDGDLLSSGSEDKTIRIWRISDGGLERVLEGHTETVYRVIFSPDGQYLASGSYDYTIRLWRVSDGDLLKTIETHPDSLFDIAFSPDGEYLASAASMPNNSVGIWSVANGNRVRTLEGHTGWVFSVAFSPDGSILASGSNDGTIRLWRVSTGELDKVLKVSENRSVDSVAFSPDGHYLASGSFDGMVRLWSLTEDRFVWETEGSAITSINSVAFSPDSLYLASAANWGDDTVRLWKASDCSLVKTFEGSNSGVNSLAFSPDGKYLATGSSEGWIHLWSLVP